MIKTSKIFSGTASSIPKVTLHSTPVGISAEVSNFSVPVVPIQGIQSSLLSSKSSFGISGEVSNFNVSNEFIQAAVSQKIPTVSIKTPIIQKPITSPNLFQDSSDLEVSETNLEQKIFSQYTGINESEPSVILMSEFSPIFSGGSKSEQGKALGIKENSKIINAKVAITVLSQSNDTRSFIKSNKQELSSYILEEDSFLNQLSRVTSKSLESLDVSSYAVPVFTKSNFVGSLYETLKKSGYSADNIVKFSETKLWNQSLIELKRSLLTHTQELTSIKFNRRNISSDSDPFILSDVEKEPEGLKRIWINPYLTLPTASEITNISKLEDNISNFSDFDNKQFVNLSISNSSSYSGITNNISGFISSFSYTGRDISIVANTVLKELTYSSYLLKPENYSSIEYKFNYRLSPSGDNFPVWDYIVGRFPRSVLQFSQNPTGNKNSLSSFSQEYVAQGESTFNILTFENNVIEGTSVTPGSSYYIDSSLMTLDGRSFDTSRLDQLIRKTKEAHDTTKTIVDILGYNIEKISNPAGFNEKYVKKSQEFNLDQLIDKLSIVASTYKKCAKISSQKEIDSLDSTYMSSGFGLTLNESVGIRLASLICKAAVYPTKNFEKTSNRLKSLLFLWTVNVALKQIDTSINNDSLISSLKTKISEHLASIAVSSNASEITQANKEARTFPLAAGSSPGIRTYEDEINDTPAVREKKAALITYVQSVNYRVFQIDPGKGIWFEIIGLLKKVLTTSLYTGDFTSYSGISKFAYVFSFFDLVLRIVSSQTPENLLGTYSTSYEYNSSFGSITISETGFLIDKVTKSNLNECFDANYIGPSYKSTKFARKISDAVGFVNSENTAVINHVAIFRKYLLDLGISLGLFSSFLKNNFESHIATLKSLYDLDTNLNESQKTSLMNLTFSEEQIRLTRYLMSEIKDRIKGTSNLEGQLRSLPTFSDFPRGFSDFLPLNETDMVSYTMLSPYFKSIEFLKEKGSNKKIISIGIPPRLNRKLRTIARTSTISEKSIKEGLIRIKIYKIDRLHPDIVYLPKTYLFEMNRFPTRVISNWNYDSFVDDDFNLLNIPSKLIDPEGNISLKKNYIEAFPASVYGDILKEEEKFEIYSNHSTSFLLEEYLRWFTDIHFDESRYVNFSGIDKSVDIKGSQYKTYLGFAKNNLSAQDFSQKVAGRFTDPTSGETFTVPISSPEKSNSSTSTSANTKSYVIPMDSTILSYFSNETLVIDPSEVKRRISCLKKFDRVFTVVFDPDDFYVDTSVSSKTTLESLKNLGILVGGDMGTSKDESPYKNRDTVPGDVTLDEYFVTLEPYDYVQEYEEK